jgi:hypothetical protein
MLKIEVNVKNANVINSKKRCFRNNFKKGVEKSEINRLFISLS